MVRSLSNGGQTNFEQILIQGTRVAAMSHHIGFADTCTIVYTFAKYANDMLNVYKPMTEAQLMDIAEEFVNELHWVTIEDISVFFFGIPKEYWGHINNRFDAAVIWNLWDVYATKRQDFIYNRETAHRTEVTQVKRIGNTSIGEGVKKFDFKPKERKP